MTSELEFQIDLADPDDVATLQSLDRDTGIPVGKSPQDYSNVASHGMRRLVLAVRNPKQAVGFLVARAVGTEWEVENVVVASTYRQRGLGARLIHELIARADHEGAVVLHLEVRESNAAAVALYRHAGFEQTGTRKAYYSNPEEDALLFSKPLKISS